MCPVQWLNARGGLFASLNHFVSNYSEGRKLEDIVVERDRTTERALLGLGVSPKHAVFQHLGNNKTESAIKQEMSEELIEGLVKRNVLATHPDGTLTFHH